MSWLCPITSDALAVEVTFWSWPHGLVLLPFYLYVVVSKRSRGAMSHIFDVCTRSGSGGGGCWCKAFSFDGLWRWHSQCRAHICVPCVRTRKPTIGLHVIIQGALQRKVGLETDVALLRYKVAAPLPPATFVEVVHPDLNVLVLLEFHYPQYIIFASKRCWGALWPYYWCFLCNRWPVGA